MGPIPEPECGKDQRGNGVIDVEPQERRGPENRNADDRLLSGRQRRQTNGGAPIAAAGIPNADHGHRPDEGRREEQFRFGKEGMKHVSNSRAFEISHYWRSTRLPEPRAEICAQQRRSADLNKM